MSFEESDYSHWCKYNPVDIPEGNFWESFSQDRLQNYWAFNAYLAAKEKYSASAERMTDNDEHEEIVKFAAEIRDIIFDDANDTMQGAMVGSPLECIAFAKWWIQRAQGIEPDVNYFRIKENGK